MLKSLDNNSFAETQLRLAFCSAATQIANTGTLSTDWRTWAANQLGLSADAVQEKIDELNAAVTLALNNPQAARAYVKGCKPFSV